MIAFGCHPSFKTPTCQTPIWVQNVFEYVVTYLLGWALDADKSKVGQSLTILGLQVTMGAQESAWVLDGTKAKEWADDIRRYLTEDRLLPTQAFKFCGRLAFLNVYVLGGSAVHYCASGDSAKQAAAPASQDASAGR